MKLKVYLTKYNNGYDWNLIEISKDKKFPKVKLFQKKLRYFITEKIKLWFILLFTFYVVS